MKRPGFINKVTDDKITKFFEKKIKIAPENVKSAIEEIIPNLKNSNPIKDLELPVYREYFIEILNILESKHYITNIEILLI